MSRRSTYTPMTIRSNNSCYLPHSAIAMSKSWQKEFKVWIPVYTRRESYAQNVKNGHSDPQPESSRGPRYYTALVSFSLRTRTTLISTDVEYHHGKVVAVDKGYTSCAANCKCSYLWFALHFPPSFFARLLCPGFYSCVIALATSKVRVFHQAYGIARFLEPIR
jgi:hypothetical protein